MKNSVRDIYLQQSITEKHTVKNTVNFTRIKEYQKYQTKVNELILIPLLKNKTLIKYPRGLIIRGPTGVGKMYFIKSICSEYNILLINDLFTNEKELREIFRKLSVVSPAIIVIEDIDTLEKNIVNELCRQMDNLENNLVIGTASTNKYNDKLTVFDRFENEIVLTIPTEEDRKNIFERITDNKLDCKFLSKLTPGFLLSDIQKIIRSAGLKAISNNREIENIDILEILKDTKGDDSEIKIIIKKYLEGGEISSNKPTTFDEIGALENVKKELYYNIIFPSKYPQKYNRLGIKKASGILLHGPSGCGKTMLARAISNICSFNFVSIKGPELINKYVGDSERELRRIFEEAKQMQPSVIFFDEIDSLAGKRNESEFGSRIVNQFLTLLDGIEDRGNVYVIGATNRIDMLDTALLRPGRFDKIINVSLPTKQECLEIFKKCIENIPIETFNYEELNLEGLSGAEIAGLVKEAAIMQLMKDFEKEDIIITKNTIVEAVENSINRKLSFSQKS
ncbi:AAA ATPase [Spraguea lophii 42_110]|uniref:AAA ATPase n=1 Tax=Spraguea lophii (strain 42_110) TaxID=1358809 RepID=S7W7F0_SPRLO|nr:AAA ATPase [Spraguea lophii 42_110]